MIEPRIKKLEYTLEAMGYSSSPNESTLRIIGFLHRTESKAVQLRLWETTYQSNFQYVSEALEKVIRAMAERGHKKI
ncbi:MAG: hypothetical protein UY67_C0036G0012 [Candidatus Kaiserbacteria bacterium GW2011_GWA2_52_12]|uniref:Uncharacterized protein n=1 Tax=Candidatus Kaiserbacteria bacterium GW2011_GWA2_52_12 TaxID=1618671 RepID=A0A0G1Z5K1_9BACT|nr:MAG: hypothetical protein UY67_C0036G0012 [Candidatus Kaiserbacteria bacterium GW2011_GWA2_52_12]